MRSCASGLDDAMSSDPIVTAGLVIGGISLAGSLFALHRFRRKPVPAPDAEVRILLGTSMGARAFLYALAAMVPMMAIGILVPIAGKEWYPGTWIQTASMLFTAAWLPASVWPLVAMSERGVREDALGDVIVDGHRLAIRWEESLRVLVLPDSSVTLGFGIPGAGGDLGSLQLLIDDGSTGPDGRTGPARLVVSLPFRARGWLARRGLEIVPTLQPSGLPIVGWDAEVEALLDRILDQVTSVEVVRFS